MVPTRCAPERGFPWRLINSSGPNAITNLLQSARHDECTPRAAWTINLQGFEHSSSEAEILKKVGEALSGAAGLTALEKWASGAKAGDALLKLIASLFSNRKLGEVTLDFPPNRRRATGRQRRRLVGARRHSARVSRRGRRLRDCDAQRVAHPKPRSD